LLSDLDKQGLVNPKADAKWKMHPSLLKKIKNKCEAA
jgi:hypothetical protein